MTYIACRCGERVSFGRTNFAICPKCSARLPSITYELLLRVLVIGAILVFGGAFSAKAHSTPATTLLTARLTGALVMSSALETSWMLWTRRRGEGRWLIVEYVVLGATLYFIPASLFSVSRWYFALGYIASSTASVAAPATQQLMQMIRLR